MVARPENRLHMLIFPLLEGNQILLVVVIKALYSCSTISHVHEHAANALTIVLCLYLSHYLTFLAFIFPVQAQRFIKASPFIKSYALLSLQHNPQVIGQCC